MHYRRSSALRLGFLNVLGLGEAAAKAIEEGRARQGTFKSIGDFLERTGVLEEVALNLASAGAFDSLEPNRRKVKWEIGLRYRPVNSQLFLPLPVEQDMVELDAPSEWERMKEEYNVLSLFPPGISWPACALVSIASMCCSKDIAQSERWRRGNDRRTGHPPPEAAWARWSLSLWRMSSAIFP